jgi:hypothetical protein
MIKFRIYLFLYPFRTRLHRRLREERLQLDFAIFAKAIEDGPLHEPISQFLWDCFSNTRALVPDFRPDVNDDLARVYAMGPEEIIDDILDPITTQLNLDIYGLNFKALGFDAIKTIANVADFIKLIEVESVKRSNTR